MSTKKGLSISLSGILVLLLMVFFSFIECKAAPYNGDFSADAATPMSVIVSSQSSALRSFSGVQSSTNLSVTNSTSSYHFTGFYVWSIGAYVDLRSSDFNAVSVSLEVRSSSVTFYTNSASSTNYYANGEGFWVLAPYSGFTSLDQASVVWNTYGGLTVQTSVVPDMSSTRVYRLYFVQPFRGSSLTSPGYHLSEQKLKYDITCSLSGIRSTYGSVTISDLNNQTTQINNNITQQTQQQTQTMTKGYDNSGMESTNSSLSSSLTDYDEKENQITDQSVDYIDAAAFVKPSSNATLLISISFATSWLQSLFVALGDWSLLVTISLSLSLGLMLIGWFRFRR